MKPIHVFRLFALAPGLLAAPATFASLVVNAPIDVLGNLPLATFVGDHLATQNHKDWGNEPFVAVNPTNTNEIVVSSFAFGTARNPDAALFYSTNGGTSWTLQFTVPSSSAGVAIPNDWTFAYDSTGRGKPPPPVHSLLRSALYSEPAPHRPAAHSMTSSARARIDCEMVRPSVLAVLRLTTNSNSAGCWTGRSAGLAPLRIFPA
jgi:hypothetical protein